jgi:hypothetical protein
VSEPERKPFSAEDPRALRTMERVAPWIVFALVVAIVVLSVLSAVIGDPWWS